MWKYFYKNIEKFFSIFAVITLGLLSIAVYINTIIALTVLDQIIIFAIIGFAIAIFFCLYDAQKKIQNEKNRNIAWRLNDLEQSYNIFVTTVINKEKTDPSINEIYLEFIAVASAYLEAGGCADIYRNYVERAQNIIKNYDLSIPK